METIDFIKVATKLKELRTKNGYTQEQFADALSCTIAFISNLENHRVKVNLRVLLYYSKMCNVSIDSILNAGRSDLVVSSKEEALLDELQQLFRQFSTREQEKIVDILRIWSKE
ncbi:MAG: helix-turn-helix transcriptional regulator [Lachnospiraceae bacterium]|nr:helix-turn-helix transcriptional regulator [Lachnospiraceae bacterium]